MATLTARAAKTVLLTGPNNFLGKLVLKRLGAEPLVGRVLAVGDGPPVRGKKVKHVRLGATDRKLIDLLRREKADTVLHLGPAPNPGRDESIFERNVMGTMTLLGAAAEVGIRHVIIRSNFSIYGAAHNNPNFTPESRRVRFGGSRHFIRDVAEIERYANEFLKSCEEAVLTILRLSPVVGPTSDSAFMQYLRLDPCPVILGFDPLVQLMHESDAADAFVAAVRRPFHGPVNLAPDGVVPLLKALRFLGRRMVAVPPLPLRASERLIAMLRSLPFDPGFLRYTCGLENERMKKELRFRPAFTTGETLRAIQEAF